MPPRGLDVRERARGGLQQRARRPAALPAVLRGEAEAEEHCQPCLFDLHVISVGPHASALQQSCPAMPLPPAMPLRLAAHHTPPSGGPSMASPICTTEPC